jgi:hypothetical protein
MTAWSVVACGLMAACASGPISVRTAAEARNARGERVRIEGKAQDAKLGPVIAGDGGLVVYIAEQARWPPEALGRRVVAEGTLEETRESTTLGGLGERSAGLEGPALVLRGASFHVLPEK